MSRGISHAAVVGNEFVLPRPHLHVDSEAAIIPASEGVMPNIPVSAISRQESVPVMVTPVPYKRSLFRQPLNLIHKYSLASFALLFLLVGSAGTIVGGHYWSASIVSGIKPIAATTPLTHTIAGLSLAVPNNQLQSELQSITSQPATITVGSQTQSISPSVIKGWLTITPSGNKAQDYIQVNTNAIKSSLLAIANQYVIAPVNQVSVTHTDGITPSGIILAGQNGTQLSDPNTLSTQAQQSAKSVMNAKGLQFNTPLKTVSFQALTPCNFPKLLEANVVTDRLYAYQGCQLVNTFLTSDGKPSTPTPLGEFHIWEKLTSQTMIGPGYVQPNVPWINYFDHSGDAIHGNYWRPASVFGSVNTSHGCVGVQVSQAEWIYNWAPIGTTVITDDD